MIKIITLLLVHLFSSFCFGMIEDAASLKPYQSENSTTQLSNIEFDNMVEKARTQMVEGNELVKEVIQNLLQEPINKQLCVPGIGIRFKLHPCKVFVDFCRYQMPWEQIVLLTAADQAKQRNVYLVLGARAQRIYYGLLPEIKAVINPYVMQSNQSPLTIQFWNEFCNAVLFSHNNKCRNLYLNDDLLLPIIK